MVSFCIAGGDDVFIATSNEGKLLEFRDLLSPYGLSLHSPFDYSDYVSPIEDSDSFEGNAFLKARYAVASYGMSAIADDSGLCCEALGGVPGVETARFGGDVSYDEKARMLWDMLSSYVDKSAYFACAVACVSVSGGEGVFYERVLGRIIYPGDFGGGSDGDGGSGWGYDPYFIPDGYSCSYAGLSVDEKNRISHRHRALEGLVGSGIFGYVGV